MPAIRSKSGDCYFQTFVLFNLNKAAPELYPDCQLYIFYTLVVFVKILDFLTLLVEYFLANVRPHQSFSNNKKFIILLGLRKDHARTTSPGIINMYLATFTRFV